MGDDGIECVVEYEYTADLSDELTLRVGDVITKVERMEGGWWKGSLRGVTGMFPDNFVKVLPGNMTGSPARGGEAGTKKKRARVLFSYAAAHDDELSLEVDEEIDLLSEVEDGWWKGRLKGRVGVFPSNFVELCNIDCDKPAVPSHAATVEMKNIKNSLQGNHLTSPHPVFSPPSHKLETPQHKRENSANKENSANNSQGSLNGSMTTSERLLRNTAPAPDTAPRLPPKPVKETCLVLFPYNAQNEDELSLQDGQIINIVSREVEDKGWWKGELDGKVGVFPDNFVKLLPSQTEEQDKDKKPQLRHALNTAESSPSSELKAEQGSKIRRSSSKDRPTDKSKEKTSGSTERLAKKSLGVGDFFKRNNSSEKRSQLGRSESEAKVVKPAVVTSSSVTASTKAAPVTVAGDTKTVTAKTSASSVLKTVTAAVKTGPLTGKTALLGHTASSSGLAVPKAVAPKAGPKMTDNKAPVTEVKAEAKPDNLDLKLGLDSVEGHSTLTNVTAKRVKAPKRRPPSSIFLKENIPDSEEMQVDSAEENIIVNEIEVVEEDKNRVETTATTTTTNQNQTVNIRDKAGKVGVPVFPSKESGSKEEDQKPSWLEELTRKQANRRSGIFADEKKPELPSPDNKPSIPSKPSDNRKSVSNFSKRPSSFADKIQNKPSDWRTESTNKPLAKAASSSVLPDISSADNRTDEESMPRSSRKTISGSKVEGSRKHSDLSRKSSDSSSKATEKPHSTNLGKPEGRSFAVPERPSDFAKDRQQELRPAELAKPELKSSPIARRQTTNELTSSSKDWTSPTAAAKKDDQSRGGLIGGGGSPVVAEGRDKKADPGGGGWNPSILSDTSLPLQDQVKELRSSIAAVHNEFSGQITALRSLLDAETEKRKLLEAEVVSLRRMIQN